MFMVRVCRVCRLGVVLCADVTFMCMFLIHNFFYYNNRATSIPGENDP